MTILRDIRLCFLGDSFVNGAGDPELLGWTGRLAHDLAQQGHRLTYYNLGIRGETSSGLRQRFEQELSLRFNEQQPALIVLSFGANDTAFELGKPRVATRQTLANLVWLIQHLPPQHQLMIIGPPLVADPAHNQRIRQLSAAMSPICGQAGIPYLDTSQALASKWAWMNEVKRIDGAHPQAGGYAVLADMVQQWPVWQEWSIRGRLP